MIYYYIMAAAGIGLAVSLAFYIFDQLNDDRCMYCDGDPEYSDCIYCSGTGKKW